MTDLRQHWTLHPDIAFLNHGSFGACPRRVLEVQAELRAEMEREPVRFLGREIEDRLDAVRAELGPFLGAAPQDLALVSNATTGVNAGLQSVQLEAGDEVVEINLHEAGPGTDYGIVLGEIFKADSIQVW